MNSTLKMLLPTTLPMARPVCPLITAPADTAISGALVPKATMVSPTTSGEMPKDSASREAPRTSRLAPTIKATRPAANIRKFCMDGVLVIQALSVPVKPRLGEPGGKGPTADQPGRAMRNNCSGPMEK